jgi:hypothetical protein
MLQRLQPAGISDNHTLPAWHTCSAILSALHEHIAPYWPRLFLVDASS